MIVKRNGHYQMSRGIFNQLPHKILFHHDLLKEKILGYAVGQIVWVLIEREELIYKVPFARSRKFFEAITEDAEFIALQHISQIYIT